MYLKSIEISGFKSFGKKSTLDFNVPISSIVGPNGSGKSNVAEAFSFVLGEQSIKSLRGKRAIGTVIWNSNKAKTYQGFIDACFDFNRFSCWNDKNPPALNFTNDYNFTVSYLIAEKIVNKQFERDGVWNQYFAHKKIKPYWYKYLTYVTVIGNHTFGYLENYSD